MANSIYTKDFQIRSFFSEENGMMEPSLISDVGDKGITHLIGYLIQEVKEYNPQRRREVYTNKVLTNNQLRKFYDTFLKIYNHKVNEKEKKIQLIMLKANSEYSAKRLTTNRFNEFLCNRINLVVAQNGLAFDEYLQAFKIHFEALVAYYPKN